MFPCLTLNISVKVFHFCWIIPPQGCDSWVTVCLQSLYRYTHVVQHTHAICGYCIHIYIYIMYMYTYIYTHYVYVCVYIYIYYVYVCVYIYIYILCICMCIYIYI